MTCGVIAAVAWNAWFVGGCLFEVCPALQDLTDASASVIREFGQRLRGEEVKTTPINWTFCCL